MNSRNATARRKTGQGEANGRSFGFTGEQSDANGLLYLRARYYDSNLGMFPSRDPFGGIVGLSNTHNGYAYVEGNPVNFADPTGLCAEGLRDRLEREEIAGNCRQS